MQAGELMHKLNHINATHPSALSSYDVDMMSHINNDWTHMLEINQNMHKQFVQALHEYITFTESDMDNYLRQILNTRISEVNNAFSANEEVQNLVSLLRPSSNEMFKTLGELLESRFVNGRFIF
ncbi:MAG: hypothetical protein ACP5IC_00240 [Minisyncoccia bacterium]